MCIGCMGIRVDLGRVLTRSAYISDTLYLTLYLLQLTLHPHHLEYQINMPDLHTLPDGSRPWHAIRNNGPNDLALERYKLRELAEGWPAYRYSPVTHHPANERNH